MSARPGARVRPTPRRRPLPGHHPREGFQIAYAGDPHGHNDYLSGLSELTARVDELQLCGSAGAESGYPHRPLRDGELIEIGDVGVQMLHAPGHPPNTSSC